MKTYKTHPVAEMFPPMSDAEFASLKEDVRANGQREPVWLHKGQVIDGRNRVKACRELGVELKTREWDGTGSLVAFVVSLNLHRRHLSPSQRSAIAAELEPMMAKEAKERQRAAGGDAASKPARQQPAKVAQASSRVVANLPQPAPKSRDLAAKVMNVSPRSVQDAKAVKEKAPDLHEKVKVGELTLSQAKQEVKRQEKREELKEKAAAVMADPPAHTWDVIIGDCVGVLARLPDRPRLIFADPPYNAGVDYGEGEHADFLPDVDYLAWVESWVSLCRKAIAPDGAFWLLISDEFAAECGVIVKRHFDLRNWIVWYETFGVNCGNKFNRCKRHLFYAVADPKRFVFHPDAVSRPSARQVLYNDGRAAPGGKLWDDLWSIPRLVGTATERIPDFPTQLPLDLLRPIVRCASDPGDLVLDPFNGSGTTGVAAVEVGRRYLGIEKSAAFADLARLRLKATIPLKTE